MIGDDFTSEPLVSIIIPVYNGENYLKQAIDSALMQTYRNVEVIVVNDGSNDGGATERIAMSYGNQIRYYYKRNGGVATALNLAIQLMKGDYFSWLSHDDMYSPYKLERQIQTLKKFGDMTAIVYSDYDLLDVISGISEQVRQSEIYSIEQLTNSVFPVLQGLVHGCSLLIHKYHFERVGMFYENLLTTQDYDLWFRMFRYQKIIYIPEPLIVSRVHDAQGSRTISQHELERDQLYMNFMNVLTEEEITSMYGSAYNFYHRLGCFFKRIKSGKPYQIVNQKLQKEEIPENLSEQLSMLQSYIQNLSNGKATRLCIFGAGVYGVRLYQEFQSKLIAVHYFSDNNPEKWGYFVDDIPCISPIQLLEEKERTLVVVATRMPTEIVNQLRSQNYLYITTKQELEMALFEVPQVKWMTALDGIENIDYSLEDVKHLIKRFKQTIFDICKYYEDRVK